MKNQTYDLVVCMNNMFVFESMENIADNIAPTIDRKMLNA